MPSISASRTLLLQASSSKVYASLPLAIQDWRPVWFGRHKSRCRGFFVSCMWLPVMGGPYVGIFGCAGVQLAGTPTHTVPPTLIGVRRRCYHL